MRSFLILVLVFTANLFAQDVDYKYDFSARVEHDVGQFYMKDSTYKESEYGRTTLSHEGSFYKKTYFYKLEGEASNKHGLKFKDNFIGYKYNLGYIDLDYKVKLGNIKVPFSLDSYAGEKASTFMESPLTNALTQTRKLGIEALSSNNYYNHRTNIFVGIFGNSMDDKRRTTQAQKIRKLVKTTYNYKPYKNQFVHFGASYLYSDINGDSLTYQQEAESDIIRMKYVSTSIADTKNTKNLSLEALYLYDSFHLQAEYIQSKIAALANSYSFNAYYAQVGYFLFGSTKDFERGTSTFTSKNIKNGDIELAFRYSFIDLNDKDKQGGTQKDYNFAANYYMTKNLKLMANYIIAAPSSSLYDGTFSLAQARLVMSF